MKRDWRNELANPGEAIGKAYKTRNGKKMVCIGDYRLSNAQIDYPIIMRSDNGTYTYKPNGYEGCKGITDNDIVDAWTDAPVKVKVKLVKLFVLNKHDNIVVESNWHKNEKDLVIHDKDKFEIVHREYKEFEAENETE